MKDFITITFILISVGLQAQNPNEKILTSLKRQFPLSKHDNPSEIIMFNKDTIIIAGYLADLSTSTPRYQQNLNVVYKSTDGGATWRQIKFNGNAWIYDSSFNQRGEIWMGGSDEYIHYSSNFGESWQRKPKPFIPVNRVLSIFMVDSEFGIAGGLHNGLAITKNNWGKTKQIPSPLDQNKFKILVNSARDRVDKVGILDSIILINQNDHIYFSKVDIIKWTEFNIPTIDFSINADKGEIDIYSLNGKHFVLTKNLNLKRTYDEKYIWEEIEPDNNKLDTDSFLKEGIKSISITSTNWVFDKPGHMVDFYKPNIEKAKIFVKKGAYIIKTIGSKKKLLNFIDEELSGLFKKNQVNFSLNQVADNLSFSNQDIENYLKVYQDKVAKREEVKLWGGDFSSQVNLENHLFSNHHLVLENIKQKSISSIFNQMYFPLPLASGQADQIEIEIINQQDNTLKLSNENSLIYSLPWNVELNGKSIKSYNPKITEFVRGIIPDAFINYEMVLGGSLIFELVRERVIEEMEYKNGF